MRHLKSVVRAGLLLVVGIALLFGAGCSPGNFFQQPSPANSNPGANGDFLIIPPPSITVVEGQSANGIIGVTGLNGLSTPVNLTITGLPSGVTASPSTLSLTPASSATVQLSASAGASVGTYTAAMTGSAAGVTHTVPFGIVVQPPVTRPRRISPSRQNQPHLQ